jgi:methionyl aminopeptidase
MSIQNDDDLQALRHVGRIVALALDAMRRAAVPGVTTGELDALGADLLARHDARSAPHALYDFPGCACISVNDEIVHGVPGPRRLAPGDVLKLDVTAECGGYIADAADTVLVGHGSALARRLRASTVASFDAGLAAVRVGAPVNAIGRAVESRVRQDGFAVIRELVGHGVGRAIHEPPNVPNYYDARQRDRLTEGLVFTIEPMVTARPARAVEGRDGWTYRTHNGVLAAHYEHTLVVTSAGVEVLTALAA